MEFVQSSRKTSIPVAPVPGEKILLPTAGGSSYVMYVVNNSGVPVPPAVMAHSHDITDVSGLQSALDSKSGTGHTHADATITTPGFMTAADKIKLDASVNYVHPDSGITPGDYFKLTINAQGHATAGSNPTTLVGFGITDKFVSLNPSTGAAVDSMSGVTLSGIVNASSFFATGATDKPSGTSVSGGYVNTLVSGSTSFFQTYGDDGNQDSYWYRRRNSSTNYAWLQVASREWVQANYTSGYGTLQQVLDTGNSSTGRQMTINGSAGTLAYIARFGLNSGYFQFENGTSDPSAFMPIMRGINTGTITNYGMYMIAQGKDSYSQGAFLYSARNTAGTGIVTAGNIFTVLNYTTTRFAVDYLGNSTVSGTFGAGGVITASGGNSTNWNSAYSWGNHASGGYATSAALTSGLAGKENTFSKGNIIQGANVTLSGTLTGRLVGSGDVTISAPVAITDRFISLPRESGDVNNLTIGGVNAWDSAAANRPESFGTSFTFVGSSSTGNGAATNTWINQIMAGTTGNLYWRQSINAIGTWSPTYFMWTSKNFTLTDVTNGVAAYNWGNHALAGYATTAALSGKENTFSKGDLVQGSNISLSGSLTGRLVGSGNVTITSTATSTDNWQNVLARGNVAASTPIISINSATSFANYMQFRPNDYGSGKPTLSLQKGTDAGAWTWSLSDGSSNNGSINFSVENLNYNSAKVATESYVNSRGFKTSITYGDVTGALGFVPYSNSNPNGYINGINSGNVTGALGFTPMRDNRTVTINGTLGYLNDNPSYTINVGVTGSGTTNYFPVFYGGTIVGNSTMYQNNIGGFTHVQFSERAHFNKNVAFKFGTTVFGNNGLIACDNDSYAPENNLVFQVDSGSKASIPWPRMSESTMQGLDSPRIGSAVFVNTGGGLGLWCYYGAYGWRLLATRVWSGSGGIG